MALSFEQEHLRPLTKDFAENTENLLKDTKLKSLDPTLLIQFDKFQKTLDFINDLQLFSSEQTSIYIEEIGKYVFHFIVKIKEKNTSWRIRRRLKDLVNLDEELKTDLDRRKSKAVLPGLKIREESNNLPSDIADIMLSYLEDLLLNPEIKSNPIFYRFLEYSNTKLETNTLKIKECYINKRAGGRFNEKKLFLKCGSCFLCWKKRYLVITTEGVLLKTSQMSTEDFRENLSFDHHYSLKYGIKQTGLELGLILNYSNRKLHIEALNSFQFFDLLTALIEAFDASSYNIPPRYGSFSPIRENSSCEWYIDGQGYFEEVFKQLKEAKEEVFITDWWLSPELHLKRPVSKEINEESRITHVLKEIAERNVKIYIIVYREQSIALENDSSHTKLTLQSLHPNIKVLRHPNHPFFLWSHHEKIVVIDQKYGFLGGLDLCYGRMDNENHHLNDPDYDNNEEKEFFPGIDFTNSRICDFFQVKQFSKSRIDKKEIPRMPWHDIAVKVEGEPVLDLCRHFIQYWNFAKYDLDPAKKTQDVLMTRGISNVSTRDRDGNRFNAYISNLKERQPNEIQESDYSEEEKEKVSKEEKFECIAKDLLKTPERSPVKIMGKPKKGKVLVQLSTMIEKPTQQRIEFKKSKSVPVNSLEKVESSLEFIQLLSNLREKQMNPENNTPDYNIMPKINEISNIEGFIDLEELKNSKIKTQNEDGTKKTTLFQKFNKFKETLLKPKKSIEDEKDNPTLKKFQNLISHHISILKEEGIKGKKTEKAKCQILRSASNWSIGLKIGNHENSIMNAYIAMILASEHFIYIENQFFISTVQSSKDNPVLNEIARALFKRITKAAKEKKKFKVIVVMPLLPGFEGDIYANNSGLLKIQLHYEYQTISRGGESLLEMLAKDPNVENPDDYISFYGLRNHGIMNNKPITEIIYVHSKLIIVDDKYTLIGSANINDRSMLGDRDSEIAMITEDQNFITSKMNRFNYRAGEFSHSLRTSIFKEHFGLDYKDVNDPLDNAFLTTISNNAKRNTEIYRKVFNCYPDDQIKKIENSVGSGPSIEIYNDCKGEIIGHAVEFPLKFLCEECLKFKLMAMERILPDRNFT